MKALDRCVETLDLWTVTSRLLSLKLHLNLHRTYLQIRVRVISELYYNIFPINSPGHSQFCLHHFHWYDWSRQNQNKLRWPREDWDGPFSYWLSRSGHATAEQNWEFQETLLTYLFLYLCTANLICDRHVIYSRAPLRVARTHISLKFYSFPVRCLKDTSWRVATNETTYLLQSHLQFPHEF